MLWEITVTTAYYPLAVKILKNKLFVVLLFLCLMSFPLILMAAQAQPTPYVQGAPITLMGIEALIIRLASWIIRISMIIAVGYIVWAGIVWMTAGDSDRVKKAKSMMTNGIIGVAIIMGVGVILSTIWYVVTGYAFWFTGWPF
jgi:hypothetical protein